MIKEKSEERSLSDPLAETKVDQFAKKFAEAIKVTNVGAYRDEIESAVENSLGFYENKRNRYRSLTNRASLVHSGALLVAAAITGGKVFQAGTAGKLSMGFANGWPNWDLVCFVATIVSLIALGAHLLSGNRQWPKKHADFERALTQSRNLRLDLAAAVSQVKPLEDVQERLYQINKEFGSP